MGVYVLCMVSRLILSRFCGLAEQELGKRSRWRFARGRLVGIDGIATRGEGMIHDCFPRRDAPSGISSGNIEAINFYP